MEDPGLPDLVTASLTKCDVDIRKALCANIVVTGGNTLFEGFVDRLKKDIVNFLPNPYPVHISALPDRQYGAWHGGAKFAQRETFLQESVSREELDEFGANIVHRKFL